jgi:hypothetical protein
VPFERQTGKQPLKVKDEKKKIKEMGEMRSSGGCSDFFFFFLAPPII